MKKNLMLLLSPLLPLCLLAVLQPQFLYTPVAPLESHVEVEKLTMSSTRDTSSIGEANPASISDRLISYATSLIGTPYVYAGISKSGFDCSGFITHVFSKYEIKVPHSSRMQAHEGRSVARDNTRPGDLVIFTGTNPSIRKPGHVGIVISQPGDTITFVHSSSNGGVKISKVEGSRYDTRFLDIRRVL